MNWWLIGIASVLGALILGLSVYVVVAYSSPTDRKTAWFPKAIVVLSFGLALTTVLLLPYDVANRKDAVTVSQYGGGLDTALMWQIILWTDAILVVVVIPFATFYYEAYDPEQYSPAQQIGPAFTYTLVLVVVFGGLSAVLWVTEGTAIIPYYCYTGQPQTWDPFDAHLQYYISKSVQRLVIPVSFFVYVVALLLVIGWFFFCIYGGVGLVALPVDLVRAFVDRPQPLSTAQFNEEKARIVVCVDRLLEKAKKLLKASSGKSSTQKKCNALRIEVRQLEKDLDGAVTGHEDRGFGPLKASAIMFLACVTGLISACWVIHIFVYNATHANPFLNVMLLSLDAAFSMLGVLAYAILALYLLWATVRGCFRVGIRLIIFQIHPMKPGDTLANAMLFNGGLVLLTSVVVTQFCVMSFDIYASNTILDGLLNMWVLRLNGIGQAMYYFQFAFVGVSFLTMLWFSLCPRRKPKTDEDPEEDDE